MMWEMILPGHSGRAGPLRFANRWYATFSSLTDRWGTACVRCWFGRNVRAVGRDWWVRVNTRNDRTTLRSHLRAHGARQGFVTYIMKQTVLSRDHRGAKVLNGCFPLPRHWWRNSRQPRTRMKSGLRSTIRLKGSRCRWASTVVIRWVRWGETCTRTGWHGWRLRCRWSRFVLVVFRKSSSVGSMIVGWLNSISRERESKNSPTEAPTGWLDEPCCHCCFGRYRRLVSWSI